MRRKSRALPPSPIRRFNSLPEVIRLVVMVYERFALGANSPERTAGFEARASGTTWPGLGPDGRTLISGD
jgi:hypothetical protein